MTVWIDCRELVSFESSSLFMNRYLAFQSVHNPYDVPPLSLVDVNATFPEVVQYNRRIYGGMVLTLDDAIQDVVEAYKDGGLWDDTVLVFSTDNVRASVSI